MTEQLPNNKMERIWYNL